ncbi:MAG: HEAT repeat domain-containing protein [Planctomycetota bacterium]
MATSTGFAVLLALASPLFAHGGQYRGPGNIVPPAPIATNSGPTAGPVGGSTTATGVGSRPGSAPARSRGAAAPAAGAMARGIPVGVDLGRWEYWWEFGKDPFLRLRDSIYERRLDPAAELWNPDASQQQRRVERPEARDYRAVAGEVAALLSSTKDRDIASSCLITLAKIGDERAGFALGDHFRPSLARGDQELRETAALAFGISGNLEAETIALLDGLVHDTAAGHEASGSGSVNPRTRAFAAYGMGLLLQRSRDAGTSMRICSSLLAVLGHAERHSQNRNLTVAAIEALGLFPATWQTTAAKQLRSSIVAKLGSYYDLDLGAGHQLVQAHVPTALARLIAKETATAESWRQRFARDLAAGLRGGGGSGGRSSKKVNHHVAQSCVLALGRMCAPWNDKQGGSAAAGRLLVRVFRDHRDQQTRAFAALALARMGGNQAHQYLLAELDTANKALEQPWLAVALGVEAARERTQGRSQGEQADAWQSVVANLNEAFRKARNPSTVGALAIALGLTRHGDAREVLRERLLREHKRDVVAGYVALGLGLLRDKRAVPDLRNLRKNALRRPFVLLQSVRALGLIGDHELTAELTEELALPNQTLVRLSATAAALGQIGDRRCLGALRQLANDGEQGPLARAFAVVALGGVCDKDPLPWNAAYASNVNYRAWTETLTNGQNGILDLL